MKILFCAYDRMNYAAGGPNSWLRRLLLSLKDKGFQVKVLFMIQNGEISDCKHILAIADLGIDYEYIYWRDYPTVEDKVRGILQRVQADPPDIFIPNVVATAFYASRWIKQAGIPCIGVLHSDDSFHQALLDEFVAGSADYCISGMAAVSKFLETKALAQNPYEILVERLPCGAPFPVERTSEPVSDHLRLIYVGRLVEQQKRIHEVTKAFCKVVKSVPGAEAIIYGDGVELNRIKRIVATEASGFPVRVAGPVDNSEILAKMLQAHIFVLLSDYEGLPISLMEAMACGLVPVCLREESGIKELIIHNENGLIVENREESFINAIHRLKTEPALWRRLSNAARNTIKENYSSEICADKWAKYLHKVYALKKQNGEPIFIPEIINLPPIHPGLALTEIPVVKKCKSGLLKRIKNKVRIRSRIQSLLAFFRFTNRNR